MLSQPRIRALVLASSLLLVAGCQADASPPSSSAVAAEKAAEEAAVAPAEATPDAPAGEPGSETAARALIAKLIDTDTRSETVLGLQPQSADYVAVFGAEFGPALEAFYAPLWSRRGIVPSPWGAEQTEILLTRASAEELQAWAGDATRFPRGYKRIAEFVQPGVIVHQFRFTKPGEPNGASWDGLVWVNGHWRIFPKPWKAAPEGSPFFRTNAAEDLCAHLQRMGADPSSKSSCEAQMGQRLIDAGPQTFEAYAACVKGLDDAARLDECKPRLGGQAD